MAEINFELYNNTLIQQLVGPQDSHLRLLEKILGVEIGSFGNQMTIKGPAEAIEQAKTAIDVLYHKVSKGIEINEQEVKAAVRMSNNGADSEEATNLSDIVLKTKKRHIYPRSATQAAYIQEMMKNELVFGLGPAGTGKTYLAVALAVSMMLEGKIDKIILSRPAVEAGENLGFLPGDLKEKVDPYLRPLYDALYQIMGAESYLHNSEKGLIEVAPLAYMRGRTLDDSFIILDEAQNTTPEQMKMFLTRLGFGSKIVITGDITQIDLPSDKVSGLKDAVRILDNVPDIAICRLTASDVVRHALVQRIIAAYETAEHSAKNGLPGQKKVYRRKP